MSNYVHDGPAIKGSQDPWILLARAVATAPHQHEALDAVVATPRRQAVLAGALDSLRAGKPEPRVNPLEKIEEERAKNADRQRRKRERAKRRNPNRSQFGGRW